MRAASDAGSTSVPSNAPEGDHARDAVVARGRRADVEVGAERTGDLLGEERAEAATVDPLDDLAEQVPLADGVVAGP